MARAPGDPLPERVPERRAARAELRRWPLLLALTVAACDHHRTPAPALARGPVDAAAPLAEVARHRLIGIEVQGRIDAPGLPAGRALVVLTDGPCFAPGSHYIGTTVLTPPAAYTLKVFPPAGTSLDVCAALMVGGGRLTAWQGRATRAPLLASGGASRRFEHVDVTIRKGPELRVPDGLRLE